MSPQGRVDLLISQKLFVRSLVDIVYLLLTNFFINECFCNYDTQYLPGYNNFQKPIYWFYEISQLE